MSNTGENPMSDNAVKMADVFNLPVEVEFGYGEYPTYDECRFLDFEGDEAESAAWAINTHDTLTAENKALRESAIAMMEGFAELLLSARNAPNEATRLACLESSFKTFTREAEKARAALKLGEGL